MLILFYTILILYLEIIPILKKTFLFEKRFLGRPLFFSQLIFMNLSNAGSGSTPYENRDLFAIFSSKMAQKIALWLFLPAFFIRIPPENLSLFIGGLLRSINSIDFSEHFFRRGMV